MVRDTADHACRLILSDVVACSAPQTENARLKEENLQLQAKVDVLMSQLHGQVRRRVSHTRCRQSDPAHLLDNRTSCRLCAC